MTETQQNPPKLPCHHLPSMLGTAKPPSQHPPCKPHPQPTPPALRVTAWHRQTLFLAILVAEGETLGTGGF